MAFQPFGYKFDIRSRLSPAQAKVAIRERKKDWFEPADGARGWIAGSFICLWFSAYDSQGPVLLGWISPHGSGSRITGRAGSDLNGVAFIAPVLLAIVLSMACSMIVTGDYSAGTVRALLFLAALLALGLWCKHVFRKEAQPLVRFLKAAVADESSEGAKSAIGRLKEDLALSVAGEEIAPPVTLNAIEQALLDVGAGDFLVLALPRKPTSRRPREMRTGLSSSGVTEGRTGTFGRCGRKSRGEAAPKATFSVSTKFCSP
jgi:hypothetical protein